jgi:hypothetical protein
MFHQCFPNDMLEKIIWQVVSKIEIRQVIAHPVQANIPNVCGFFSEWVMNGSRACERMAFRALHFESLRVDHATLEYFSAHGRILVDG